MKRVLIPSAVAVVGVYGWLSTRESNPDPLDPYIVGFIGATTMLCVISMAALTRTWSVRAAGLLYLLLGLAIYALGSLALYQGWVDDAEVIRDSLRALWIVSTPMLLFGLLKMLHAEWRSRHDAAGLQEDEVLL